MVSDEWGGGSIDFEWGRWSCDEDAMDSVPWFFFLSLFEFGEREKNEKWRFVKAFLWEKIPEGLNNAIFNICFETFLGGRFKLIFNFLIFGWPYGFTYINSQCKISMKEQVISAIFSQFFSATVLKREWKERRGRRQR